MTAKTAPLRLTHHTPAQLAARPASWFADVLGVAQFAPLPLTGLPDDLPAAVVPMPWLGGFEAVCEAWHSDGPLTAGRQGRLRFRHGEAVLFGSIAVDEDALPPTAEPPLARAARAAYGEIFRLLDARGFPHLLRCWNFFTGINRETAGLERYRQFNVGRQDAFLAAGRSRAADIPAASALGTAAGPLSIHFLAGREAALAIENPRQVSAYCYPEEYGPRSPSFSRAGLLRHGGGEVLFISGTSSIVGHLSVHPGDVAAQTHETLANLGAIIAEANRRTQPSRFALEEMHLKVYVRHPQDAAVVRAEVEAALGASVKATYLQADVCRADLLVEIEATGCLAAAS